MRRVLGLVGLIGLGVLMGFVIRLLLPREDNAPVYVPPTIDVVGDVIGDPQI